MNEIAHQKIRVFYVYIGEMNNEKAELYLEAFKVKMTANGIPEDMPNIYITTRFRDSEVVVV